MDVLERFFVTVFLRMTAVGIHDFELLLNMDEHRFVGNSGIEQAVKNRSELKKFFGR